jgi:histidine ammonia-lyase
MTALACLAFARAEYLGRLASRISALAVLALRGNAMHFRPEIFELKPHRGQARCAAWIRSDLPAAEGPASARLQDRYSIRCAPHVIGVLVDALAAFRPWLEVELNSVNDNPVIDPENELVMHGGHFYGGHVAFAMDSLKNAVANVADLLDRQMALLVDPKFNHGLPPNLSGAHAERAMINHGFKAVQIAVSAWAAEAAKLTMPASVFSRSTECHNQDKVSMGTIAARDCLRVLELSEQVTAAMLMAAMQGVELRIRAGELCEERLQSGMSEMRERFLSRFAFLSEDRPLDEELRDISGAIRDRSWSLYE